jgi:L-histidine N-alpha-methyltransferase
MVALARKAQPPDTETSAFAADVLAGLTASPKRLPPKYFYDDAGSLLFERITELREYYPTRCELTILREHAGDIAQLIPTGAALVEFGSGSTRKARILLRAAHKLGCYVPVDICGEMVEREAAELRRDFPALKVLPVTADFTRPFDLPAEANATRARTGFFPGSTIGNFDPDEAVGLLGRFRAMVGEGGHALIGVDLQKESAVLNAAYNDGAGLTSAFNLNVLNHLNTRLDCAFVLDDFAHRAFYNEDMGRVEMHLDCLRDTVVHLGDRQLTLRAGQSIHTENSWKYTPDGFRRLAAQAGFVAVDVWTDPRQWFSVHLLRAGTGG